MPSKKKATKSKTTTNSNKNRNTVIVNVGAGSSKSSVSKKGVQSFTKGNSYTTKTPMRSANLPNSTTVINNMPSHVMPPMIFPMMEYNRTNAIENSIQNIGSDVQSSQGRINRPSPDEIKSYIPSSIDSMRTQLASSAESRMKDTLANDRPSNGMGPMSLDTQPPVPMSINTSQQSSSMSTAPFGGSDDSSGGGGRGYQPPNSPSVQTASTPARIIDRIDMANESSASSSVETTAKKPGKIKIKPESVKDESEGSFDTPKSLTTKYFIDDATPVVAQSLDQMTEAFSGKPASSKGSNSPTTTNQSTPRTPNFSDTGSVEMYSPSKMDKRKMKIQELLEKMNKIDAKRASTGLKGRERGELKKKDFDYYSDKLKSAYTKVFDKTNAPGIAKVRQELAEYLK